MFGRNASVMRKCCDTGSGYATVLRFVDRLRSHRCIVAAGKANFAWKALVLVEGGDEDAHGVAGGGAKSGGVCFELPRLLVTHARCKLYVH